MAATGVRNQARRTPKMATSTASAMSTVSAVSAMSPASTVSAVSAVAASALAALLILSGLAATPTFAAEAPIPAPPTRFVTDSAGFLSATARAELDERLVAFEKSSGHQVLLWIGRTTGDAPIEDWAARAFAAWRVGRKGLDDGIVLFIMGDDRKLRIEVGYGLEDRVPDARAASIIRERIVPPLRAGDRDGAARAGVNAILVALGAPRDQGGATTNGAGSPRENVGPQLGWGEVVMLALLAIFLIGFLITHPGLAILLLTHMVSGRGGRRGGGGFGGFGGGGGFSGGGGRSGGGGATGSW